MVQKENDLSGGHAEAVVHRTPWAMASGSERTIRFNGDGSQRAVSRPIGEIFVTEQ
jgi:hypothetical protein